MHKGKHILVTGANGYLGAQFCEYLAGKGYLVTALCFPTAPTDQVWCRAMQEVLVGSIADEETIAQLAEKNYDTIIHLVSLDHRQSQEASMDEVLRVNVKPCWNLLHTFVSKGLKTFLFFSTVQVYGNLDSIPITENTPTNPSNVYALTHRLAEQVCDYFNQTTDVNCITVRLSNSYGHPVFPENNCWWLAVNDLCKSAFYSKKIQLLSNGSPQRDFIHGSDVCRAVETLLERAPKKTSGNIYHISSSKTYTLLELAGLVQETYRMLYGERLPVNSPDEIDLINFDRFAKEARYCIENNALRSLGFEPVCDLQEGIKKLFQYFETHPSHA